MAKKEPNTNEELNEEELEEMNSGPFAKYPK